MIQLKPLIKSSLEAKLQEQIGIELEAFYTYKAVAIWCNKNGLFGAEKYFIKQSGEEQEHADKVIEFLLDRNSCAKLPDLKAVEVTVKGFENILSIYLQAELKVEQSWKDVVTLSKAEKDETVYQFAQWYLDEQVKEIATVTDLITTWNTYSCENNIGFATERLNHILEEM